MIDAFARFWELITRGGWLMWPILGCSVVALAVIIERALSYRRARVETRSLLDRILRLVQESRHSEAVEICRETPGPVAKVLEHGILLIGRPKRALTDAMEEVADIEMLRLERRLSMLGTIAHISPLLGLLGTVVGMIEVFQRIESLEGNINAADLAQGIWTALLTTAAGLTVAIPALVAYNYFTRQTDHFGTSMELAAKELLDTVDDRVTLASRYASGDEDEDRE